MSGRGTDWTQQKVTTHEHHACAVHRGQVADLDKLVKVVACDVGESNERLPELAPAVCGHRLVEKLVGILFCHAVQFLQEILCLALRTAPARVFNAIDLFHLNSQAQLRQVWIGIGRQKERKSRAIDTFIHTKPRISNFSVACRRCALCFQQL